MSSTEPEGVPVQFGAFYVGENHEPADGPVFGVTDFAAGIEAVGFDSVWCGDHVVSHQDGLTMLGALAAATKRVAIGTAINVMPLRPPAITAKGILTAAVVAEGRQTVMGAGPGGDVPADFAATGADLTTRGAFTDEALDVIRLLWSGERVTYKGRWNQLENVKIDPLPSIPPKIFVGGRSDAALRRSLRVGDGYLPYLVDPEQAKSRFERLVEMNDHGRSLATFTFGLTTFLVAGDTVESATDHAISGIGFRDVDRSRLQRFYLLGNTETVVDRLREYVRSGATHILIGCNQGNPRQLDSYLETMAEVLAHIRRDVAEGLGSEARERLTGSSKVNEPVESP